VCGHQCMMVGFTHVCRRTHSLSPLECVAWLPEKRADMLSRRTACRRSAGARLAMRGRRTLSHCAGSSPAAFSPQWFVSPKRGAWLPPFLLLDSHADLHYMILHGSIMVVECGVTQQLRCTCGSPCRLQDVWIVPHQLQTICKSRFFFESLVFAETDVDKVTNIIRYKRCQ